MGALLLRRTYLEWSFREAELGWEGMSSGLNVGFHSRPERRAQ